MSATDHGVTHHIELNGHLLDSLTLSKVMDRVQALGGDYVLEGIEIGMSRKDLSQARLTILARDEAHWTQIFEAIADQGAVVVDGKSA
ncbi:MAG: hypothetical protein AB7P76_03080 [Candidatus Melainabacteria bacterium]